MDRPWSENAEAIRREIERDAMEAMAGVTVCTGCGTPIEGEPADAFWTRDDTHHVVCAPCALKLATDTTTNVMDVPEVPRYARRVIEGGTLITYEQRDPGERDWRPVRLFTPDPAPVPAPLPGWVRCPRCGEVAPVGSLRDGRYQPCRLAALARSA